MAPNISESRKYTQTLGSIGDGAAIGGKSERQWMIFYNYRDDLRKKEIECEN